MKLNAATGRSNAGPPNHDHEGCRTSAIRTAELVCARRGVKLTDTRRRVLELIWESHQAVKAYDLLDRIKPVDRSAKPATVYRALDFLLEQGLIHRIESLNAFIGCCCSGEEHEQLLLICVQCQEVEERPGLEVMDAVAKELKLAGFSMHRKAIEVHGVCARCASNRVAHSAMEP